MWIEVSFLPCVKDQLEPVGVCKGSRNAKLCEAPPAWANHAHPTKGNVRILFPVKTNKAFATAGAIGGVPGSPTPPGGFELAIR